MLNKKFKLFLLALISLTLFSAKAIAEETKIGYLNTERILNDSAPAKAAGLKLQQEFGKREKELTDMEARLRAASEKYERDAPVMAETERQRRQREVADLDREFQRKRREFSEDANQRRNEEAAAVFERAKRAMREIAEKEKYDLILVDAPYSSKRIDITDKVINAMSTGK